MGQFLNSREPYDKYRTVILELKVDHTPEEAIAQIKEKEYALRFKGKMAETERYTAVSYTHLTLPTILLV